MTVEEIFKSLSHRMLDGIMLHSDMVDYYRFLSLKGYAKCHEYRMIDESKAYRKLRMHYLNQHDRLIRDEDVPRTSAIPDGWYSHTRQDVDTATIKNGVKDGLTKWVTHETGTLELYEDMAKELRDMGETEDALFVEGMVCAVAKELAHAKKYHLNKEHIGYDLPTIVGEQECVCEKYKHKIKEKYSV